METKIKVLLAIIILESLCFPYYIISDQDVDYTEEYSQDCDDIFNGICFDEESEFYKFDLSKGEYDSEAYEIAEFLRSPRLICG